VSLVRTAQQENQIAGGFPLKKVFPFTAPKANYHCDAAILWCFDNRFELTVRNFLHSLRVIHSDSIQIAGGAKCLASPDHDSSREFVLQQIRLSMRLHGTTRVMLMLHSDCGAYGGLASGFSGDSMAEAAHHRQELQRAADNLTAAIPGLEVQTYFVDFDGVWATHAPAAKEEPADSREQEPPPQFQAKASSSLC